MSMTLTFRLANTDLSELLGQYCQSGLQKILDSEFE